MFAGNDILWCIATNILKNSLHTRPAISEIATKKIIAKHVAP